MRELVVSYRRRQTAPLPRRISSPNVLGQYALELLGHEVVEIFGVLCLTTRHAIICYHEVGRGTSDRCLASPREVFRAALLCTAPAVALLHNHPSGDPTPSPEDTSLTSRLVAAGRLLDITVIDHVIAGEHRYFSFKEEHLL